ncbi:MAG: hypothetical protein M0042_10755 [Nitrospiraceae bacterium]|nr:hypothetical protein [Nitrospiraceae bacterium]
MDIMDMIGKEVEVMANGVTYKGILIEASDTELHLKSMMQWMSLPMSTIGSVRLVDKSKPAVADRLNVNPEDSEPYK